MDTSSTPATRPSHSSLHPMIKRSLAVVVKYAKFIGPGAMVSVAYMDPGNYATDITAGASYKFQLLFVVLISNIIAIFLQSLSIKLGSVTGLNLAQMIKAHTHPYLNVFLYIVAEIAIIATDMAEVIGTAIALNMLFKIPLVAGCIISIADVLFILLFYSPGNSVKAVRIFELFVFGLVLAVVVCFCYQLSLLQNTRVAAVLRGYIPNSAILQKQGIYQSCGILGATVMPHSLYLGSGTIQPRLLEYDQKHGLASRSTEVSFEAVSKSSRTSDASATVPSGPYLPSLRAIRHCMRMSVLELTVSLSTFALFVNSAILIVAGASLYSPPGTPAADDATNASLFAIHDLLSKRISPAAGTLFGTALLLSGISAGIVCTIAGQIICEGQINWRLKPWQQRILTRSIAITPSVIIAGSIGQAGVSTALEASQVVLCFCLPVVTAPLIWFTAKAKYQKVQVMPNGERIPPTGDFATDEDLASRSSLDEPREDASIEDVSRPEHAPIGVQHGAASEDRRSTASSTVEVPSGLQALSGETLARNDQVLNSTIAAGGITTVQFHNHWSVTAISLLIWLIILAMNLAAVVMLALGVGN